MVDNKRVVISQSMYFPWVGLLEQIRLTDIFVHYDDVQFSRGFFNRVQIKTSRGIVWMTVPLKKHHQKDKINEIEIDNSINWQRQHKILLKDAFSFAPYCQDVMDIVDGVFSLPCNTLNDLSRRSIVALAEYFELVPSTNFYESSQLNVSGNSTDRLLGIVKELGGNIYITGHGAKNYLNHELFLTSGISVEYMNYQKAAYPQLFGEFTPYVSALDLIANCGAHGKKIIHSGTIPWQEFVDESK
ncbi:WbqC family protein [Aeromonas veronii]